MPGPVRPAALGLLAVALLVASLSPGPAAGGGPSPASSAAVTPDPTRTVLIGRVYPHPARDDEFVEVDNPGDAAVDLSGWSLTDREETAVFPGGTRLGPGARLVATRNATSYLEDVRTPADLTYDRGDAPRMAGGVLRLADAGDEVLLLDPAGNVVDAYVYGTSTYVGPGWIGVPSAAPGQGEIATRASGAAGLEDHDDASDWDGLRAYRLGQSSFDPVTVDVATRPAVIVSPEDGRAPLLSFLGSAVHSVDVAAYTLTSSAVAAVLAGRSAAGVKVRVLLEGAPVGGIEEAEAAAVDALLEAGAEVRFLTSASDAVKRYRYLHAKYAVVDGAAVFVGSENLGDSGFPPAGESGNRGWSVIVEDLDLARQLWEVFEEDFDPSRSDSVAAMAESIGGSLPVVTTAPWAHPEPVAPWRARLLVGPDDILAQDGILGALASARDRISIEAFYADESWDGRPNPLLEAAFAAARRGVTVRILLDGGSWSADEEPSENAAVAGRLNERARREGADLEARVLAPGGTIERLHNKGFVVDGKVAVVSSMNWAHTSATMNREIGLLLEETDAAERFESVFLRDWAGEYPEAAQDLVIRDPAVVLALYGFVAAASAASLRKLRRRDKGLKPRSGMVRRVVRRIDLRRGHREVRLLPPELVAEPGKGARGGSGDRRGGEGTLPGLGGPPRDRDP